MTQPSRIVTAIIEPIDAKKLLPMKAKLQAITAAHEPGTAPPDFDHPVTKRFVARLPQMTYGELETARALLMKHDRTWVSNARDVDGWLRLVNAELQQRDRDRELQGDAIIKYLTQGAR